ncbi:ABC transporter A, ABCA, partial [Kipferlia bialata]
NGFISAIVQTFEDPANAAQWGYIHMNETNHFYGDGTTYSGMWRNVLGYTIDTLSEYCVPNYWDEDQPYPVYYCERFPNVVEEPFDSEYEMDQYLYDTMEWCNNNLSMQDMVDSKAYVNIMPNAAYIVREGTDMFLYDAETASYPHKPETIVADYTIQMADLIGYINCMQTNIMIQGTQMLLIFEGIVSDLIVSGDPEAWAEKGGRSKAYPSQEIHILTYPIPMGTNTVISSLTFPLLCFVLTFVFVIHITSIIQEKENKLKENMLLAGMRFKAYYISWMISCFAISVLVYAFVYFYGLFTNQPEYTDNAGLAWVIMSVSWGIACAGVSLCYAAFFTKTKTAIFLAVIILLFQAPIYQNVFLLLGVPDCIYVWPFFLLFNMLSYLTPVGPLDSRITMDDMTGLTLRGRQFLFGCAMLVLEGLVYGLIGSYLDNVLPTAGESRLNPLFFLGYIFPEKYGAKAKNKACEGESSGTETTALLVDGQRDEEDEDADVALERERVQTLVKGETGTAGGGEGETEGESGLPPLVITQLKKVFPATGRDPANTAVHRTSLAVDKDTCFGLLGENGAGKSTTINLICGTLRPTSGTVYIAGGDVTRLDKARLLSQLGVCPQHDRLHLELTVHEEVVFYMRLRGLSRQEALAAVDPLIESVGLTEKRDHRIGALSGGMQRRCSLAIALTGRPSILLLD